MKKTGFTLTELLAVMAALSVIMGISVVMLIQAFDFQRANDQYVEGVRTANRLVADFRSDIRAFGKPEILTEGVTLLRWDVGTEAVDYTVEPGKFPDQQTVVRTVRKDGQVSKETYSLPDRSMLWFAEGSDAGAGLVVLSLWTTPTGAETPDRNDLNPFDRTLSKTQVDPKCAGNWRTIIARY